MTKTERFWITVEGFGLIAAVILSWVIFIWVARGLGRLLLQLAVLVDHLSVRLI